MIDVIDVRAQVDSVEEGFAVLRVKAAALGADAVLDADVQPGHDGGLYHLSGMAVRYVDAGEIDQRPYDIVGVIDITTLDDDDDKGRAEMLAKAQAMGADSIRDLEFQYEDGAGNSHLRGVAIVHRD